MIFDAEDAIVLNRTLVRKRCESVALSMNPHLDESGRRMMTEELDRDVERCQLMVRIAGNDFCDIGEYLEDFIDRLSAFPPTVYEAYMSSMDVSNQEDEGRYIWMLSALISMVRILEEAVTLSDRLQSAEPVFDNMTVADLTAVRNTLAGLEDRCVALDDPDIEDWRSAFCSMCSLALRISTGKRSENSEISDVVDAVVGSDPTGFMEIFGDQLEPATRLSVDRLLELRDYLLSVLCAGCILNSGFRAPVY